MLFAISEVGKKYIGGNFKLMNTFNQVSRASSTAITHADKLHRSTELAMDSSPSPW